MNSRQIGLLAELLARKAEFAVVGGVAVNAHGYIRATNDLDLFIRPTEDNARAVYAALVSLGIPPKSFEALDLLDDEDNLRFGPSEDHIDILPSIGAMPFEQVWRNRVEVTMEGLTLPFISKADLIENKLQVGRHRDLADAEELARVPSASDV